jgi:hypothetical protein
LPQKNSKPMAINETAAQRMIFLFLKDNFCNLDKNILNS